MTDKTLYHSTPVIETERLILRGWEMRDLPAYTQMMADEDVCRFIGGTVGPDMAWRQFAGLAGHWALHGFGFFVVEEKETGAYMGRIGPHYPVGWPHLEIGWTLVAAAQGKGYAVEAAAASAVWLFETKPELTKFISVIDPDNRPSQKVAERLGMTNTGEIFEVFGYKTEIWEISRTAWVNGRAAG